MCAHARVHGARAVPTRHNLCCRQRIAQCTTRQTKCCSHRRQRGLLRPRRCLPVGLASPNDLRGSMRTRPCRTPAPAPSPTLRPIWASQHPGQTVRLPGERKIRKLRNRPSHGSWGTRFGSCEAGWRHPAPPDGAVSSLKPSARNRYQIVIPPYHNVIHESVTKYGPGHRMWSPKLH